MERSVVYVAVHIGGADADDIPDSIDTVQYAELRVSVCVCIR